ncbi:hypothetical protein F4775DRAFT_553569, partial [Biscogniauxia sp. FL1348]
MDRALLHVVLILIDISFFQLVSETSACIASGSRFVVLLVTVQLLFFGCFTFFPFLFSGPGFGRWRVLPAADVWLIS